MLATDFPHVVLRTLTVADAPAYHGLLAANRDHLMQHGDYESAVAASVSGISEELARRDTYAFGIWQHAVLVGRADLIPVDPPKYGLGYLLASSATGQGIGTVAVRAVLSYARDHLQATDVFAGVTHGNLASVRLLQRLGFEKVTDFETYARYRLCFT